MVAVYKAWQQIGEVAALPTSTTVADEEEWQHCLAECNYQLQTLQRKIKAFQLKRNALLKRCRILEQLMAANNISADQKEWAAIFYKEALYKLQQYSEFALQRLHMQEALL